MYDKPADIYEFCMGFSIMNIVNSTLIFASLCNTLQPCGSQAGSRDQISTKWDPI